MPTILITGATDGLGRHVARDLAGDGWTVLLHGRSRERGARASERLIADPALEGVTGRYFNGDQEARADPQAYDAEARERLWTLSERLTS